MFSPASLPFPDGALSAACATLHHLRLLLVLALLAGAARDSILAHAEGKPAATASGGRCDADRLSVKLVSSCNAEVEQQSPACCRAILVTVDGDCLCAVGEDSRFATRLFVPFVWRYYDSACGGRRRKGEDGCSSAPAPAPASSPPPPAASSLLPASSRHRTQLSSGAVAGIISGTVTLVLIVFVVVGVAIWLWKKEDLEGLSLEHTKCEEEGSVLQQEERAPIEQKDSRADDDAAVSRHPIKRWSASEMIPPVWKRCDS